MKAILVWLIGAAVGFVVADMTRRHSSPTGLTRLIGGMYYDPSWTPPTIYS